MTDTSRRPHPDIILREIAALLPAFEDVVRGGPEPADLKDAPITADWSYAARGPFPAIAGLVAGHPILPETAIVTSQTVWCDPDAGHARTRSRWYRLGPRSHIVPAVSFGGRILPPLTDARARASMIQAPTILLAAAHDLRAHDLAERMAAVVEAWPPETRCGRLQ